MMANLKLARGAGVAVVALLTLAMPGTAQVANASAAAMGMGENYTAAARGYNAVAWNPAVLGLVGNPSVSVTVASARGIIGLDPVTLADLADWQDKLVPDNVKQQWLNDIRQEESQAGTGGADITYLAVQAGPVAFQVSSTARLVSNISPGVAELILFGNADDQGNPKAINLSGSTMDMQVFSTGALSFGLPFTMASGARVAVGATAKYTVGHFVMRGAESQGQTTADPIAVQLTFPIVHSQFGDDEGGFEANGGSGFGVDLGASYQSGRLTLGAAVQNLVNTFEWDESLLRFRPGTAALDQSDVETDFDTQPVEAAPAALRQYIEDQTFKPSVSLGAALRHSDRLTITGDARFGSAEGMNTRPPTQVGAGVEFRPLGFLPLRAGAAFVKVDDENSGFQFGGGIGLELGGLNLSASLLRRNIDLGTDDMFMIQLVSLGN
jgi:hypothetical protein